MIPKLNLVILMFFIFLISCASIKDQMKFKTVTYNTYYMNAGYKDADGGFFPTNRDTFPLPQTTRDKIANKIPGFLIPESITLDYTFLSSGLQRVDSYVIKSNASDHWPLIVEMKLSK